MIACFNNMIFAIILLHFSITVHADEFAAELMREVLGRYQGETRVSTMSLATCPYKIDKGKILCESSPRKKKMKSVLKNYGKNMEDAKGFTLILEPLSEKGIGVLQYDYEQKGKDADQWLYLPALGKIKRVASDANAPKKGSLFGSEFSLEDIEKLKFEDYSYRVLREEVWNGRPVLVIEQIPTKKRALKTNYSKRIQWADKERFVILKSDYYGWNSELIKSSYNTKVQKIDDIWTAKEEIMRNVQTDRISILTVDTISYNVPVSDDILTHRILNDPAFRKRKLNALDLAAN